MYTVVIPALNEAGAIGHLIDRLHALSHTYEIVVVNDGSTDRTADIAREKGAIVISHPSPAGYGRSVKDGVLHATHDIIVMTDADGTYPIEDIPRLLAELEKGFDMVVGARKGKHYRGSFLKMPARIFLKWLVEFTTGRNIPDINSGFRAFRKAAALPYIDDLCNGFSFTTTITLVYVLSGKFVHYIPIDYFARIGSSKVRIFRDSLRTLQYITEIIAIYNPLKLYVILSIFLGIFACIGVLMSVVFDPSFLQLTSMFIIGAIITFGIGIHAFIETKTRSTVRDV